MNTSAKAGSSSLVLFGAGRMGGALLDAWRGSDLGLSFSVVDPHPSAVLQEVAERGGISLNPKNPVKASVLVLSVKPQLMDAVLPEAKNWAGKETLVLSVAAGTTLGNLKKVFGRDQPIIRVMPNTPALVGRGMSVLCADDHATADQKELTNTLFRAVGKVAWLADERLMDAVTAVSGSGPAYGFLLAEAMAAAGEAEGLEPEMARDLAMATVAGAGEMMWQGKGDPATLRENVTSPGGTTAAALEVLRAKGGMEDLLRKAVAAATKRGKELGKG